MKGNLWKNQKEAYNYAMNHNSVMLDMDMGTGKTLVALNVCFDRKDVRNILIVSPKSILIDKVWRYNLKKFGFDDYLIFDDNKGSTTMKIGKILSFFNDSKADKNFIHINYESVWRNSIGEYFMKNMHFDMIILDESHRIKAAGSKVSKYLYRLGKNIKYKMCLSGTPMGNSSLDIYGQYRFLDDTIFGTNHQKFLEQYAIFGGPERKFVVGVKNQQLLYNKFNTIAFTCKLDSNDSKIPKILPPVVHNVELDSKTLKLYKDLNKNFIAECNNEIINAKNILEKMLRLQQLTSGFYKDSLDRNLVINENKKQMLIEIIDNIRNGNNIVIFCTFKQDLESIKSAAKILNREYFELSGRKNTKKEWDNSKGAMLGVQIQAGAEGVDLTKAHYAIYYTLPHSLFLYNQSKSRIYRPGQHDRVSFNYIITKNTIDEQIYKSLLNKQNIIESIKNGSFDFGYLKL